jgi:hypothetical protein
MSPATYGASKRRPQIGSRDRLHGWFPESVGKLGEPNGTQLIRTHRRLAEPFPLMNADH